MKRVLGILLTLVICLTMVLSLNMTSYAETSVTDERGTVLSITATPASVETGAEVTVSVTIVAQSDMQMTPPLWQKVKRTQKVSC